MDFSLQIVKQALLNEAKEGFHKNFACSPFSVATMLSMLTAGTDEHKLKDFLSSLGCKSMDELNSKSLELMNVASSKGTGKTGDPLLFVANGCWVVDQRYSLNPFFKETLQSIYKVESKAMDFENKGDEVVDEVNSWVKNETKGLIQGILDSSENLDMLKVMQELGLKEPSIMLCSPHCQEFPASASINHKAVIEVNETGTEAAAVTDLDCGCCLDAPPPVPFVADHPFVFMIMEDESRIPLFIGAVRQDRVGLGVEWSGLVVGGGQWKFEKWVCGMGSSEWWVRRSRFEEWVFWVSGMGVVGCNQIGLSLNKKNGGDDEVGRDFKRRLVVWALLDEDGGDFR
ncbi:hypothetical protein SO802_019610 [Lithocarpus litseifolius]|uniref:Serpin domain-containing protein n=1 Tax=Lithocarpus litseifolius TaxID=425828 RepID=A0AAW2CRG3_9ROSI